MTYTLENKKVLILFLATFLPKKPLLSKISNYLEFFKPYSLQTKNC